MVSFLGTETSPSSGDFLAHYHAEKRGLPRAVGAHQSDLLARDSTGRRRHENNCLPYCLWMPEKEIIESPS